LDITFVNCKFIYSRLEVQGIPNQGRRKSTIQKFLKAVQDTSDELFGAHKQRYEGCTFFPGDEEDVRKQMSTYETESMKFRFIQCKFVRRDTTIMENVVRKLRRFFGIVFQLNYVTGAAEITGRKFKIKDVPDIIKMVVERIQDD